MRKKSQEELGTLVTREMKVMLQDESLTKEQRFDILAAVMFDTPIKNALLASFAKSLKAGFEKINAAKMKSVMAHRQAAKVFAAQARASKKKLQRLLDAGYIDVEGQIIDINNKEFRSIDINDNQLTTTSRQRQSNNNSISPYKPPKGGKKVPDKVKPEDLVVKPGTKNGAASRAEPTANGMANAMAEALEQTEAFGRMRVNRRNLMRHLLPLAEKNSARLAEWAKEVLDGLAAWTAAWKADDWQYAPGKITKWLADEKYLQPPRKKTAAPESVGSGCGDCGAEIA